MPSTSRGGKMGIRAQRQNRSDWRSFAERMQHAHLIHMQQSCDKVIDLIPSRQSSTHGEEVSTARTSCEGDKILPEVVWLRLAPEAMPWRRRCFHVGRTSVTQMASAPAIGHIQPVFSRAIRHQKASSPFNVGRLATVVLDHPNFWATSSIPARMVSAWQCRRPLERFASTRLPIRRGGALRIITGNLDGTSPKNTVLRSQISFCEKLLFNRSRHVR